MKNEYAGLDKSKYVAVSELGSKFNLAFSSQLVLGNRIIALDGVKKTLLVVETDKTDQLFLVDLNKVGAVTVRKSYGSIKYGELKSKGIEAFLKTIDLRFHLIDKSETIVLPVYDREMDNEQDRKKLDKSAKNWQMMLSKMVPRKTGAKNEK